MADEVIQIDIDQVLKARAARYYRYIPGFAVRWLKRLVRQDDINDMLRKIGDKRDVEAADVVLQELNITLQPVGMANIPAQGRFIFASNHPLGGLDGLALISLFGHHYNGEIRFLVNDLLMYLPGLAPLCIPINKTGKASRNFPAMVEAGFQSDNHMLMFPAGLCSRRHDGVIRDIPWKKTFISKSVEYQRDVVPIHFGGQNSSFFYRLANFSDRFLPFNLAMLYLVDEMYKNVGKTFRVAIGKPIPWQTFDKSKSPMEWAKYVQDIVYSL